MIEKYRYRLWKTVSKHLKIQIKSNKNIAPIHEFSKVWQWGSSFVYQFFSSWVNYSTKQWLSNADPRYPSSAGCYRGISITRCWQNSRIHAYKFVGKIIDAKALTGWSLSSSASLVTELRKPDLRISFQIQTDFTTNAIGTEVKNSLQFITNKCDNWSMLIKVEGMVSNQLSQIWTTINVSGVNDDRQNCTKRSSVAN